MPTDKETDNLIPNGSGYSQDKVEEIPLDKIRANPYQPRRGFDMATLEELSASIKEYGVLQPILLRKTDFGYEIIAGERRLRAAKMAGLSKIPALIKEMEDKMMGEVALIENLQ